MKVQHAVLAVSLVAAVGIFTMVNGQEPGKAPAPSPSPQGSPSPTIQADDPRVFYSLGVLLGQNIRMLNLTPAELDQVRQGLSDAAMGKKVDVDLQLYGPKLQEMGRARMKAAAEQEKSRGDAFRAQEAKAPGAVETSSGMVFREVAAGQGATPSATDTVRVHYRGTLIDGTEFDSSIKRGEPAEFPLTGVIRCWTEGLQKMKVGGKAKLVCPPSIAYGEQGRPPQIPGQATLVFDVELLEIKPPASPPPAAGAPPATPPAPGASPAARPPAPPPPAAPPSQPTPSPTPSPSPTSAPQDR